MHLQNETLLTSRNKLHPYIVFILEALGPTTACKQCYVVYRATHPLTCAELYVLPACHVSASPASQLCTTSACTVINSCIKRANLYPR